MPGQSRRAAAVARMPAVMREFMARAVLFQEAVARTAGLNGTDLQCLGLLVADGPATPGQLARRSGMTAGGAITSVIDRLERAGYVSRARDTHDRRKVIVTPDHEQIATRIGPAYERISARWTTYLEGLEPEQVEFAVELLSRAAAINRDETERIMQAR